MSGPSLRKRDGHSLIHEAALQEAKELIEIFRQCLRKKEKEKAMRVAEVFIEHWESRTLAHAQSEEDGLYKEVLKLHPDWAPTIHQLTRDHDLMRRMVLDLKERLAIERIDAHMVKLMDSLVIVDEIHNEEEMAILPAH